MIGQLTNHLFQSTLFAIAAALLVLAFRKNQASVRYSLWLVASLKFLVPFSMLIALGSQIHWAPAAHAVATPTASPDVVQTVEQFSEPFTATIPTQPRQTDRRPFALAAIWFCGFAFVTLLRLRAWRGMRTAIRRSQPIDLGLPVEARLCAGVFEPGIVGLWRPVLLLPQGILERLTPSELEAVIAHELCHIHRRDNLFAAIHMVVEALFWFHPLVWWIGARLLREREQACDESVLSQGNQPDIYADAIINVCKLYTESPLACVSGVTGADIRRRLEAIMSNQKVASLNLAKKTLLACATLVALATPLTIGLLIGIGPAPHLLAQSKPTERQPAPPAPVQTVQTRTPSPKLSFEAASIRPSPFGAEMFYHVDDTNAISNGMALHALIAMAFNFPDDRITQPAWTMDTRFDIQAKLPAGATSEQVPQMLQSLLEDRFGMKFHHEQKMLPVYELTLSSGRPKFKESNGDGGNAPGCNGGFHKVCGQITMEQFATMLSRPGQTWAKFGIPSPAGAPDRPVIDATGLTAKYDFVYEAGRVGGGRGDGGRGVGTPSPDAEIITAEEGLKALGLRLEPAKHMFDIVVVDRIERTPTEN